MLDKWSYVLSAATAVVVIWVAKALQLAFNKDLRLIPGPLFSRFTRLPLKLSIITGNRAFYIHGLHEKYGPVVRIAPNEVAFASAKAWHEIHKIGSHFRKDPRWYQGQSPYQYDDETCGVFGIVGHKKATQRRRLYQQAGTKAQVKTWLEPMFVQIIDSTINKIKRDLDAQGRADVHKWWSFMTTDILGEVAFGESFGMVDDERAPQLIEDIESCMLLIGLRQEIRPIFELLSLNPFRSKRPTVTFERLRSAGKLSVRNTKQAPKGGSMTIFSKMYPEDDAPLFSDVLMADEAANLIIAGSDTTAMALINLTYEVLRNPAVKTKLLKELAKLPKTISWDDLEQLEYLDFVIQEVLRLDPSVPSTLPRACMDAPTVVDGYSIPAGTSCATQVWTLHRNPEVFPNPEIFDPERWRNPTKQMREHWSAFGGSMRSCVGQNIARMEMLHAVARFFISFPNAELADTVTKDSMAKLDFFVMKRKGGKLEIKLS